MEDAAQCSRGSRDDRKRTSATGSLTPSARKERQSVGASASPLGKDRRCWRLRQHAFTGAASEISFVARRGEHPGVPDRIGLQGVLLGGIDLFTGVERARGNALGLTRVSSRSLRSEHEDQVAARRSSPAGDTPISGRARRGAHESVVGSRPAEPDASRYPASARIESSFACLGVMASRSSLSGRGARCARRQRVTTRSSAGRRSETDAAAHSSIIQGQNLGYWVGGHGAPR